MYNLGFMPLRDMEDILRNVPLAGRTPTCTHTPVNSTWMCIPHGFAWMCQGWRNRERDPFCPMDPYVCFNVCRIADDSEECKIARSIFNFAVEMFTFNKYFTIGNFFQSALHFLIFSYILVFFLIFFFQEIVPFGTVQYCLCSDSVSMTSLSCFCQNKFLMCWRSSTPHARLLFYIHASKSVLSTLGTHSNIDHFLLLSR